MEGRNVTTAKHV